MPSERVIWGPPGTGKTSSSITLVRHWMDQGTPSEGIAFLAFTKSAAKAAAMKIFENEDESKMGQRFPYFRTLHSLCYMGLRKSRPDQRLVGPGDMKQFAKVASMDGAYAVYDWEDLAEVYAGMRDNGRTEWDTALAAYQMSRVKARSIEDLDKARVQPNSEGLMMLGLDNMSLNVYQNFVEKYERFKTADGLIDYTDMLEYGVREMKPFEDIQYVILDECQDLAGIHHLLVDKVLSACEEIWWVGDDDQCLPGDEKVLTADGYKPIRDIQVGDQVVSGESQGKVSKFKVTAKSERPYFGNILKITTESGKSFRCTPEHKVFCLWDMDGKWIVYLMRQGDFYRIGITKLGGRRMNFERQMDGMMPIAVFDNETDARVCEVMNSLGFGIPTCVFPQTTMRKDVLSPKARLKIYEACDSKRGAQKLLDHYGKTWEPMYEKGVQRGKSSRKMVNLYPLNFQRKRASSPMLTYEVGGSREACKEKRLRKNFGDLKDAYEWLEKNPLEGFVFERWSFVPNRQCYRMMACNLIPQISRVPCLNGDRVVSEKVISVEYVSHFGSVYDIEVEKAHNFCASGVLVSNCIYKFSGASAELFLERAKRARVQHQLRQTHRFGQKIVDFSAQIIKRVVHRHPKEILAVNGQPGEIYASGQFEPIPGDVMIMHRHVQGCQAVAQQYMSAGLPFRNERGLDPLGFMKRINIFETIRELAKGGTVTATQAALLIDEGMKSVLVGDRNEQVRLLGKGAKANLEERIKGSVSLKDLMQAKILTDEGASVINEKEYRSLNFTTDHEYYERLTKNGHLLDAESYGKNIPKITTIHGSKGRQAEQAVVFVEMSTKCWDDYETEHRLAYVASTRTETNLFVCYDNKVGWARSEYDYPLDEKVSPQKVENGS